uniref:Uncharacterized protein n=1 Tax=Mycena chlorophos TaxID=658473 RepID=A0ABQ0LID5_MYCCL|nr:predicted protein [Mycena chlorophos]
MDHTPTNQALNPHMKTTRAGNEPAGTPVPETLTIPFTFESFRHIIMPLETLLQNLCAEQAEAIRANPSLYLGILPFNAGSGLYKAVPKLNQPTLEFIKTLGYNTDGLQLAIDTRGKCKALALR